ncbi:hypothetical protein [Lysobacter capsici]|uniref:hypothetical protein n=1 Tax=Lysobacter capsici TaxID=435897 RepID=UPI00287B5F81|nr:hypothetical protein [Lysobacter capsici]WND84448.1 hypothetical protein RJ609_18395 [Lysobacter capsici]
MGRLSLLEVDAWFARCAVLQMRRYAIGVQDVCSQTESRNGLEKKSLDSRVRGNDEQKQERAKYFLAVIPANAGIQ